MGTAKTVAFHTLGCKLNFAETSTIARGLARSGYEKVEWGESADLYVINTCSVTENADRKCRKAIGFARRRSPDAKVVVVGCYAQLKPDDIVAIEGVDMVLGAREKFDIQNYLGTDDDLSKIRVSEIEQARTFSSAYSVGERTRSFLKVQDGCDYSCSYCTIPAARGRSRSDTINSVVDRARELGLGGVREIVLTGVNTGDFGLDEDGNRRERFVDLLRALDRVEEVQRFRISSIEPNLLNHEIIEMVAGSERLMPHFHIPMQSGSDRILKLMRRRYLTRLYRQRIERIKELMPSCCIGVDVIVGFPGESEEDFLDTYRFLADLDVSYLHVFPYSERPGTDAVNLPERVPQERREERSRKLRHISVRKRRQFYQQNMGTVRPVLFEEETESGIEGFTDNYVRVACTTGSYRVNDVANVLLDRLNGTVVSGTVAETTVQSV